MKTIDRETIITGKQMFDLYNAWDALPEGKAHFNNWVREQPLDGFVDIERLRSFARYLAGLIVGESDKPIP